MKLSLKPSLPATLETQISFQNMLQGFASFENELLENNVIYLLKTLLIGNSTLTVAKVLSKGKSEREISLRKKSNTD